MKQLPSNMGHENQEGILQDRPKHQRLETQGHHGGHFLHMTVVVKHSWLILQACQH